MAAGPQHDGQAGAGNGAARRGRDAALTWDVPPPLEAEGTLAAAARPAFAAVAAKHLEALVAQLLVGECVQGAGAWTPVICQLAQAAAAALSPTAAAAYGRLDPRHYIKVKRVLAPGAAPADSSVVLGVACRKSLAHKRMRSSIQQPRVVLLAGGLEAAPAPAPARGGAADASKAGSGPGAGPAGGGGSASKLSSFDSLLDQEQRQLDAAVDRIASLSPDVLLVERSVPRYAQELLLARDISLVLNVKPELLERIARCTGALVAPSLDQLTSHCVGFCNEFEVESAAQHAQQAGASAAPSAGASLDPSPRTPEAPDAQHLVADAAAMHRAANFGAAPGAGAGGATSVRALMSFRGCPRPLGSTIVLRGGDAGELRRLKRVACFAAYAAYWGVLESALLADQLAAAAAAVLPADGGVQPDAVAGLADAVASTSYLATAEARGRQAILSASPHVSVVLEPGTPANAFDLATPAAGPCGAGQGAAEEEDDGSPDSPASSDSTNLWVLPAEAGAATFTVSGSQTETEEEAAAAGRGLEQDQQQQQDDRQQDQQQQVAGQEEGLRGGAVPGLAPGAGATPSSPASPAEFTPGSPQDPLHRAAKELAMQRLQLPGGGLPGRQHAAGAPGARGGDQQTAQAPSGAAHMRRDSDGAVGAGLPSQPLLSSAEGPTAEASGAWSEQGQRCRGGAGTPPALAAYHVQRLWLAISCKNPAKAILCEPSHAHCMDFYADSDLPLAAFLSAAAPPHRKCPHPQCGEGAPLHLRSFVHGNGLVTLSSMRLPAGRELPDGRLWLWARPTGGAGGAGATRRVALSAEAACLSFAHLLSLLLDARHLALGGVSLQRGFVRYLGAGPTLLCLHYSPVQPYRVCMPPRQVALLPGAELEWLQEEIKQLTEEADEAFDAIEFALVQQLDALERQQGQQAAAPVATAAAAAAEEGVVGAGDEDAGSAGPDPEFRAMWLDTLGDTRAAFLDMVQDTIALLDSSPRSGAGEQEPQQAQQAWVAHSLVSAVWEINRLRSMLAAVVLQWANCLHEGTPGSHAAPPSSASALSAALAGRRLAGAGAHSRRESAEAVQAVAPVGTETEAELSPSPFSQLPPPQGALQEQGFADQAAGQQEPGPWLAAVRDQRGGAASEAVPVPPRPSVAHALQLPRDASGSSLAHQFLEAGPAPPPAAFSDINYGAPSLVECDGGAEGSGSLLGSPTASRPPQAGQQEGPGQGPIPTGLVARCIAMFDQRSGGSAGSSPAGPGLRSQRTREWVQASDTPVGGSAATAGGDSTPAVGARGRQVEAQEAAAGPFCEAQCGGAQQQLPPGLPPLQPPPQQRFKRPSFRLDLSNPDPELVRALTPKRRSATDEAEAEAAPSSSRLEQVAARLGRMTLSQSFTERRRSYSQLRHALSADSAALRNQAAAVAVAAAAADDNEKQQQAVEGAGEAAAAGASADDRDGAPPQQASAAATVPAPPSPPSAEASGRISSSHWEWNSLLDVAATPEDAGDAAAAAEHAPDAAPGSGLGGRLAPLSMLKTPSGRLEAIARLQEAPMPPSLVQAAAEAAAAAAPAEPAGVDSSLGAVESAAPALASRASSLLSGGLGPLSALMSQVTSQLPSSAGASVAASPAVPPPLPPPGKQPSKLMQLLGKLRSDVAPGQLPLTTGRVELSGRALLPGGADGMRVAVFDDEPTSIIAYFLATREYQDYLHDAVADILFGQVTSGAVATVGAASAAGSSVLAATEGDAGGSVAATPGSWESLPDPAQSASLRGSSLVPGLQSHRSQQLLQGLSLASTAMAVEGGSLDDAAAGGDNGDPVGSSDAATVAAQAGGASDDSGAVAAPPAAPLPLPAQPQQAAATSRAVSQEELAAEQSGDWQVLFCEQQLNCQLALEDPSPGMPWGRAKFQVTAYYAPQFAELRRRCVAGGEAAFLASISRCRKWASRGGKSAVYFARTHDKRYIIKQLSRSERQSFLEFAPDYFRYLSTALHRGQDTCLAKILGVYQVSVQYTGGRGAPAAPPFGGKDGVMDLLVTENVFYGRDAQVSRIYDLKGSQRDRYAADDPAVAGAVLLDENLKELNLSSPTLVGPRAYASLQRALWSDSGFLAGLGVMDYSLLVGVDKASGELIVGVIDYIRQYTWDKQVETWVKKSGILGGAGKDPTVISPKQYSRRFRAAMSSYLTVVPAWENPEPPLDPDAM